MEKPVAGYAQVLCRPAAVQLFLQAASASVRIHTIAASKRQKGRFLHAAFFHCGMAAGDMPRTGRKGV